MSLYLLFQHLLYLLMWKTAHFASNCPT
jgi:hypothetical protein